MTRNSEIPSDAEVRAALQRYGSLTASGLVKVLEDAGHSRRDSQRAVQRCLDRGKIVLGSGLRLSVALERQAA